MTIVDDFLRLSSEEKDKIWSDLEAHGEFLTRRAVQSVEVQRDYNQAIALYDQLITHIANMIAIAGTIGDQDRRDQLISGLSREMSISYHNLGVCHREVNPRGLNRQIQVYLCSLSWDPSNQYPLTNLWSCIYIVQNFLSSGMYPVKDKTPQIEEWMNWHNLGYEILKTPSPPGTPGRNWEGAVNAYRRAIQIHPVRPESWHGLGLAYSGLDMKSEAIAAWLKTYQLNPNYNFEVRIVAK